MLITAAVATFGAVFLATLAVLWPKSNVQHVRPLRKAYFTPTTLVGRPVQYIPDTEPVNDPVYKNGKLVGWEPKRS